ncbi:CLUMA_CG019679, isoform A [Clunio marinus]|uniref:CLUMA_CG019679, isoform A n=1 Tax=Clunio marinus TaxID=568069 RepID=A0A1J1J2B9_9DIPT|nr:CLUMA_CG019679, isoform A [Clunio marinus]
MKYKCNGKRLYHAKSCSFFSNTPSFNLKVHYCSILEKEELRFLTVPPSKYLVLVENEEIEKNVAFLMKNPISEMDLKCNRSFIVSQMIFINFIYEETDVINKQQQHVYAAFQQQHTKTYQHDDNQESEIRFKI